MRVFGETLLIIICLHLLGRGSGQSGKCKPEECWNCLNNTATNNCTDGVRENCTIKDFNVTIKLPNHSLTVEDYEDVTVICDHDVPGGSISWLKDNELQENEKNKTFQILEIKKTTNISCNVESDCGDFNSTITITVKPANHMVVILICVGAAAGLLMLFGIGMKIVLRRGQVRSQARKRQRQQNMENIHSTVNTVTSYY